MFSVRNLYNVTIGEDGNQNSTASVQNSTIAYPITLTNANQYAVFSLPKIITKKLLQPLALSCQRGYIIPVSVGRYPISRVAY